MAATDRILLISSTVKGGQLLQDILGAIPGELALAQSGAEARRNLTEGDYALVVVNAPLTDEFGHDLALDFAANTAAGVVLLVKAELYDEVAERAEPGGIFCLTKPMTRSTMLHTVKLALAAHTRLNQLLQEKRTLERRLEQQRLVDRAKFALMEHASMTEAQAHRYLVKQAMDLRTTKESVANQVLSVYEV
ncbi:MAG TPA: ANTAR domain-containing protein [Feifaniaceae bacterium]|nr:ANTAR domain-containing protein [Feifaniaceae bacterium]